MRLDRHCYLAAAFKGFLSPSHGHGGCYTTGERAPSTLIAVRSEPVRGNRAGLTASLSLPIFHHQPACQAICVLGDCPGTRLEAVGFGHSGIQANVRPARQIRPRGSMLYFSYLNFIFIFCGSGVVFGDMRGAPLCGIQRGSAPCNASSSSRSRFSVSRRPKARPYCKGTVRPIAAKVL